MKPVIIAPHSSPQLVNSHNLLIKPNESGENFIHNKSFDKHPLFIIDNYDSNTMPPPSNCIINSISRSINSSSCSLDEKINLPVEFSRNDTTSTLENPQNNVSPSSVNTTPSKEHGQKEDTLLPTINLIKSDKILSVLSKMPSLGMSKKKNLHHNFTPKSISNFMSLPNNTLPSTSNNMEASCDDKLLDSATGHSGLTTYANCTNNCSISSAENAISQYDTFPFTWLSNHEYTHCVANNPSNKLPDVEKKHMCTICFKTFKRPSHL